MWHLPNIVMVLIWLDYSTPVYITNGAGGNRENFQPFIENYPPFSAVRLREWGKYNYEAYIK